jgi:hypothetical protein
VGRIMYVTPLRGVKADGPAAIRMAAAFQASPGDHKVRTRLALWGCGTTNNQSEDVWR